MVLVSGNWRIALVGMALSLVIFLVLLFAVILPSQNTADQAIKTGLQQGQQALNQAQKQLKSASQQSSSSSSTASSVTKTAQHKLSQASKLAGCISAAGTDVSKVQACQAKFTP